MNTENVASKCHGNQWMQQQQIVEEMSYVWKQIKIYWICSKSVFHTTSHNSMYACVRTCANYNCDHRMTAARTWLTTGQRAMTWYHRTQHTICGVQKLIINFNAEIIWYNHWHTGNTQYIYTGSGNWHSFHCNADSRVCRTRRLAHVR